MRFHQKFSLILTACVVIGLMARAWLMWRSDGRIEYDEAMVGLMATGILAGERPAFLAAQPTLGAGEAYFLALLFAVFGVNTVVMRVLSLIYTAIYIAGVGTVGRLAFGKRVGILAALLAGLSPLYVIAVGTKVWTGTMGTLAFGTWLLVLTWACVRDDLSHIKRLFWFAALGLLAGVAFWTALMSAYFLIPCIVVMLWWMTRHRIGWTEMALDIGIALVMFFAGSAPFWFYNAANDWITLQIAFGGESSTAAELIAVAIHLRDDLIPRLGSGSPEWGGLGATARMLAGWLYAGSLIFMTGMALRQRNRSGAVARWLVIGVGLSVPLVYTFSGYARNALNPYGIDATGRYVLMWHTVLPIGVAASAVGLYRLHSWLRWSGATLVTLILTLNLLAMWTVNPVRLFDSPYYDRLPADLTPLIDYLEAQAIHYVWTDVGIAHPLIFYTSERIIAADYWDAEIAGGAGAISQIFAGDV